MKIAVCVPCYRTHVQYIPELLESIDRQTILPDIVSISISGWKDATPSFQCKVPVVVCSRAVEASPAENRNWAGEAALDSVDVLSFIDADDIMHPRRIELIKAYMEYPGVHAIYHSYREWASGTQYSHGWDVIGQPQPGAWEMRRSDDRNLTVRMAFVSRHGFFRRQCRIHAAHVSVTRDVFRCIQFPLHRWRSDDSEYIYDLYRNKYRMIVLKDELTLFRVGATTLTCCDESSCQS